VTEKSKDWRGRRQVYVLQSRALKRGRDRKAATLTEAEERLRPRTRGDCASVPRPCPWAGCRYNLFLDVSKAGSIRLNWPGCDVDEMTESCALDVAERGPHTLEEIGQLLKMTREGVRQLTAIGMRKVRIYDRERGGKLLRSVREVGTEINSFVSFRTEKIGYSYKISEQPLMIGWPQKKKRKGPR
jgi:hypothetical protein